MLTDPREALIAWRQSIPYTQREVAEAFGVSHGAVGWWEAGLCRVPARVQKRLRAEGWLPKRRRRVYPAQHHAPPCIPYQSCASCRTRHAYAVGRVPPRWNAWQPEHLARIRVLAGTLALPDLAAQLSTEFGIPRTPTTVRVHANRHGISIQCAALSTSQLAYYCARTADTVQHWAARGWLTGHQPSGPHAPYVFTETDFETFLRAHYAWLDWSSMPRSRWRDLVELLWRRDPIYTLPAAARLVGVRPSTLRKFCAAGTLAAERIQGGRQAGRWWAVRRSALALLTVRRPASLGNQNSRRRAS